MIRCTALYDVFEGKICQCDRKKGHRGNHVSRFSYSFITKHFRFEDTPIGKPIPLKGYYHMEWAEKWSKKEKYDS